MSDNEDRNDRNSRKRRTFSLKDAADQASEYFGFLSYEELDLGDGGSRLRIPNQQLLPPEIKKRMDLLRIEFEDCDREEDVELTNGNIIKGPYLDPRRRGGELVEPSYEVGLAIALWGEDGYERFAVAAAKLDPPIGPGIIGMVWAKMDDQFEHRQREDHKSYRGR